MVVVTAAGNNGTERRVPRQRALAITVGGLDDVRNTYDQRLWRLYHSNYGRAS